MPDLHKIYAITHEFLVSNDIKYVPFYGTLLGIIRERDFIEQDDDVDVIVNINDMPLIRTIISLSDEFKIVKDVQGMLQFSVNNYGTIDLFTYQIKGDKTHMYYSGELLFDTIDIFPLHKSYFKHLHISKDQISTITIVGCNVYSPIPISRIVSKCVLVPS